MTDADQTLMLEILKNIQAGMARVHDDLGDVKHRLGSVESGVAVLSKIMSAMAETSAHQWKTLDRFSERIERIERRLDLVSGET
jgi:uncharacterized coiled-coil protein SlyX